MTFNIVWYNYKEFFSFNSLYLEYKLTSKCLAMFLNILK
jgi:hypothetical protein